MASRHDPPRLARRILRGRLTGVTGASLLGDLEEGYRKRVSSSPLGARVWYWRQTVMAVLLPVPGVVDVPGGPAGHREIAADLGRALRTLRRRPLEALTAILPLGLGIGVVATAFSIVWGTVLTGLPFEDAHELVHFERARLEAGQTSLAVTPHDYLEWRAAQTSFEDLGAYVEREVAFPAQGSPPQRYVGVAITPNAFALLRSAPALGRTFTEEDAVPGADPVILLSHRLWVGRFGADPGIVGRVIDADGRPTTVVGVMPEGFGFPISEELWVPLRLDLTTMERGSGRLDVFGRLRTGATLEGARAEMEGITRRLADAYPDTNAGISASLRTFNEEYVGEDFTTTVYRLLLGAVLVLVVCCANVANLLLIRGLRRRRDLAVRRALGASSRSIVRQLVGESLLLSGAAALLGIAIAAYALEWFGRAATGVGVFALPHGPDSLFWWDVGLNAPTLLATVAAAGLSAVLAGLVPAWSAAGASDLGRRATLGVRRQRLQRGIVVSQLALTAGLLVAAGFVARSVDNAAGASQRLVADDVMVLRLSLPSTLSPDGEAYADLPAQSRLVRDLEDALAGDPAIRTAGYGSSMPLDPPRSVSFRVQGSAEADGVEAGVITVGGRYFDVFGIAALEGRLLTDADRSGSPPVAVVNESFARRYLDDGGVVGRALRLGAPGTAEPWVTVVGVVPDLWERPDRPEDQAGVYLPLGQLSMGDAEVRSGPWRLAYPALAVAGATPTAVSASLLGDHVFALDPGLPVRSVETMEDRAERRLGRYEVWGRFWMAFAGAALLLAGLGIYGVLSYGVTLRSAEIGVRRALGASARSVQRQVMARTLADVALGVAVGLWMGSLLTDGIRQVLYGVDRGDPAVFAGVAVLVASMGLVASWWPARRASRIDPRDAIRAE